MNESQKPIIELKNISKSFNSESILSNFNFTLYENKFITILGPSGSGKTTIISHLYNYLSDEIIIRSYPKESFNNFGKILYNKLDDELDDKNIKETALLISNATNDKSIIKNIDKLTYAACVENLNSICDHPSYSFEEIDICNGSALKKCFNK